MSKSGESSKNNEVDWVIPAEPDVIKDVSKITIEAA